jgi:hypothetical protein
MPVVLSHLDGRSPWTATSMVAGLGLLIIILAHHESPAGDRTVRGFLLRVSFAAAVAASFCITLAWHVQELHFLTYHDPSSGQTSRMDGIRRAYTDTNIMLAGVWTVLTVVLTALEPRVTRALDRPWRREKR